MSSIDVTNVRPALAGEGKRELDVRLTQVMDSLDRTRGYRQRWLVVARTVRAEPTPTRATDGPTVAVEAQGTVVGAPS